VISSEKEIGWGILGGGKIVESNGPAFWIPDKSRIVAVARRNLYDAKRTAAKLDARNAVTSLYDLVSNPAVDAVYIASPPGLHFEAAKACHDAGKAAYVEKPFVIKSRDARALVEMFASKDLDLFVAHYRRAVPKFRYLKSLVSSRIGQVVSFDFQLSRRLSDDVTHPWLFNPTLSGGGKFADIAAHSIDLLVYFFGPVADMWAAARHLKAPNGREDCVVLALRFEDGVCGTLNYDFLSPHKTDRLSITGTDAVVHFSVHDKRETIIDYQDGQHEVIDLEVPELIEGPMIEEVVDTLLGVGGDPCRGSEAIETVRIMEFALNSLH
jgi:1,5-anhydro-D-fructose reductase (1,5-anhydro-D-mannitol-forming)